MKGEGKATWMNGKRERGRLEIKVCKKNGGGKGPHSLPRVQGRSEEPELRIRNTKEIRSVFEKRTNNG